VNFFEQMTLCITKPEYYGKMAKKGLGRSIFYIWILTTILFLIWAPLKWGEFNRSFTEFTKDFKAQAPEFKIQNGQLDFKGKQPYYLMKEEDNIIVVDTTGEFTLKDLDESLNGVLITKDKIHQKTLEQTYTYELSALEGLDKKTMVETLPYFKISFIIGLILIYAGLFILKFLTALALSFIGHFYNERFNKKYTFSEIYSMAIYAWTLPMLVDTALNIIGIDFLGSSAMRLAMGSVYLISAIKFDDSEALGG
jgi:maltodextrin utilization protein YvdJ